MVYYAINKTNQQWEETKTGYVQVASRAVRNNIIQEIAEKALKLSLQGKQIAIKKARSKSATDRDRALRKASDLLKKTEPEQDIEIVWSDSRGVKVRGQFAYWQGSGDSLWKFVNALEHLAFDDL